ncbi:hypothetical protein Hanom_Chr12g01113781 [Helianthus anomalus]
MLSANCRRFTSKKQTTPLGSFAKILFFVIHFPFTTILGLVFYVELNAWLVPVVFKNCRLHPSGLLVTRVVPKLVKNKLVWSPTLTSVNFLS